MSAETVKLKKPGLQGLQPDLRLGEGEGSGE